MIIKDNIYGEFKVGDAVVVELLRSPSLLRLKNISQYGVPDKYYHLQNYSRYEHSVGVMLLLGKLGATLEEQVAGLIHDVSHFAFSHVADWVFSEGDKGNEDLQNTLMEEFVRDGEIARTLTKHGFSVDGLLNEENYSLLEKKIPDLCADRVDYAMREFKYWLNPGIVEKCLDGLVNYNGEIVFTNQETAFLFASNFLELQTRHWGGFEAMVRYHLFSEALKLALQEGVVKKKDFYKDEPFILAKLENHKNQKIEDILRLLKKKDLKNYKRNSGKPRTHDLTARLDSRLASRSKREAKRVGALGASLRASTLNGVINNYTINPRSDERDIVVRGKRVFKKFRYVDPKVIINGELIRLSSLSKDFTKLLDKHRKINEKGLVV